MTTSTDPINAFAFQAQSNAGEPISGTIDAGSVDDASRRLRVMQLRVIEVDPVRQPPRPKPLRGGDFQAFNTQLAHLTTAGLPIEQSLRLIAEDMRSGRLTETVRQIAQELESGQSLPDAFEKHSAQFPPLYGQLIKAGIRTGNLPGMLLNLGRHLELVSRLRAILWRAISYPLMVIFSLLIVLSFLGLFVFPQFTRIFQNFHTQLPVITHIVIAFSDFLLGYWPVLLGILIALVIGAAIGWRLLRRGNRRQGVLEIFIFPLPLIGPAMRRNLLARWCDGLKLGVEAGLDLPAAITLAGEAVASPGLQRDGAALVEALQSGQPLDSAGRARLLPPTVITVISMAAANNDLPSSLNTLGQMFQQQAELKMALIPTVLTPLLIILLAVGIGLVVWAMFAPMISLFQTVSGPSIQTI
jgi:type IV pilus assembly protein PilC